MTDKDSIFDRTTEKLTGQKKAAGKLVALKDFHIFAPGDEGVDIKIKEGDDLSQVPQKFHANLKTEGVI